MEQADASRREVSDSKHTPGPWVLSAHWSPDRSAAVDTQNVYGNGPAGVVAHVVMAAQDGDYSAEREANLRLVVAAPDLLEALHKLREPPTVTGDADTISAVMDLHELQCAVIDLAIAKATQPSALVGEAHNRRSEIGA